MQWLTAEQVQQGERVVKRLLSTTILRRFRHSLPHWRVGLRVARNSLREEGSAALPSFHWIESPRGHFYADPMVFEQDGRTWLFVEDYLYAIDEARSIMAAEVSDEGQVGPFMPALTMPGHVSYPLAFRHDGDIYMVPETAADRHVRLYRAERFPFTWRCEGVLFPHPAYDTTPFEHEGTWYFFTTLPEGVPPRYVTHLFWSESLTGRWRLHPASPVAADGDGRGAGPIFREADRVIRPTQCGVPVYGYSFSFDEIVLLDRRTFVQRRLATFEPTWRRHLRGMHTYGRAGQIEVIDGCWGVNPYDVM